MGRSSRIILNGKEFNLFKDYLLKDKDQDELGRLPPIDKLKFLEERARLVFFDALVESLNLIKAKSLVSFHELNLVTLVCCVIESLGHYLTGDDKCGSAFRKFVDEFMPDYSPVRDELWENFRNGLAHGFCIKHGGIERGLGCPFKKVSDKELSIDFDAFVEAFREGFENFFNSLRADMKKYESEFLCRFDEILLK